MLLWQESYDPDGVAVVSTVSLASTSGPPSGSSPGPHRRRWPPVDDHPGRRRRRRMRTRAPSGVDPPARPGRACSSCEHGLRGPPSGRAPGLMGVVQTPSVLQQGGSAHRAGGPRGLGQHARGLAARGAVTGDLGSRATWCSPSPPTGWPALLADAIASLPRDKPGPDDTLGRVRDGWSKNPRPLEGLTMVDGESPGRPNDAGPTQQAPDLRPTSRPPPPRPLRVGSGGAPSRATTGPSC